MIKVLIGDVCRAKGLETSYQLQKKADLSPSVAANLFKGEIREISLTTLNKLCVALKVQPGELLRFEVEIGEIVDYMWGASISGDTKE